MSKPKLRARLSSLGFSEKIKIMEKLRDRSIVLASAGLRKEEYLGLHLFNELRWLLHAATEWSVQEQLKLDIDGYNVQVYAMDSAFLHARALFEFLVKDQTRNHYSAKQFLGAILTSNYYDDWEQPLHAYLMHAQDRSQPRTLTSPDGPKDLNKMPVYFAQEILRLWKQFEEELGKSGRPEDKKLGQLARDKRKEAINKAVCVVNSKVAQKHAQERQQTLKPVFVFA